MQPFPLKIHNRQLTAMTSSISNTGSRAAPPPWEVVLLVAPHLDVKTLAAASCVCRLWNFAMSSDQIWQPICSGHYPAVAALKVSDPTVPYRRLYSLAVVAAKRREKTHFKPRLSLDSLVFAITIAEQNRCNAVINVVKDGAEVGRNYNGVFRFDMEVDGECWMRTEALQRVEIGWNVVVKGWKGVFTMMNCEAETRTATGVGGWYWGDLPEPGCCWGGGMSGVVADVKLGFGKERENGKVIRVEKVSVGMLSVGNWRYVNVDDGLRYLQHFLSSDLVCC